MRTSIKHIATLSSILVIAPLSACSSGTSSATTADLEETGVMQAVRPSKIETDMEVSGNTNAVAGDIEQLPSNDSIYDVKSNVMAPVSSAKIEVLEELKQKLEDAQKGDDESVTEIDGFEQVNPDEFIVTEQDLIENEYYCYDADGTWFYINNKYLSNSHNVLVKNKGVDHRLSMCVDVFIYKKDSAE